jgi:hypothetical protein
LAKCRWPSQRRLCSAFFPVCGDGSTKHLDRVRRNPRKNAFRDISSRIVWIGSVVLNQHGVSILDVPCAKLSPGTAWPLDIFCLSGICALIWRDVFCGFASSVGNALLATHADILPTGKN